MGYSLEGTRSGTPAAGRSVGLTSAPSHSWTDGVATGPSSWSGDFPDPCGAASLPHGLGSAYDWRYLHQGGRYDATSGLYHFRYRDYSPTLGRWTSLDPLSYAAGDVNLYRSLGNDPINSLDPSGLDDDIPLPDAVAVPLTKPRLPILLTLPPHLALRGLQQNESSSGYLAPWNPNARHTLEGSLIGDILDGACEPICIGGGLIRAGLQTVSLGTHALGVTGIYEYEPHSWLFQGWFQSCDEGRADEYLLQVELGVVTLGIKPLVEAIDAGDWRNVARMSGGYLAGGSFPEKWPFPISPVATFIIY